MSSLDKLRLYQRSLRENVDNYFMLRLTIKKIENLNLSTFDLRNVRMELTIIKKLNRQVSDIVNRLLRKWAWEAINTYGIHLSDDGYSSGSTGYTSDSEVSTDEEAS